MPRIESYSLKNDLLKAVKDNISVDEDRNVCIPILTLKKAGHILGGGGQHLVMSNPDNPDKEVLAFVYNESLTEEHAKQIYYSQKIMNTLFPHNFPKIYAVTAGSILDESGEKIPVEIRQKVVGKEPKDITELYQTNINKTLKNQIPIKYPFSKVFDFYEEMGLENYNGDHRGNYINADDGGQYFVDILFEDNKDLLSLLNLDPNKLQIYLLKNNYSQLDQKRILRIYLCLRWWSDS